MNAGASHFKSIQIREFRQKKVLFILIALLVDHLRFTRKYIFYIFLVKCHVQIIERTN
jgi:hypothetical protein